MNAEQNGEKRVRRNGVELVYEILPSQKRDAHTLVLIRGLGRSRQFWDRQVLQALQAHYNVLIFDNRGVGQSSKVPPPFSTADMAEDVAAIFDHAGIESAHVYGASLGGMIAQRFAIRHPRRVRKMVLGATTPGGLRAYRVQSGILRLAASGLMKPEKAALFAAKTLLVENDTPHFSEVVSRWAFLLANEQQDRLGLMGQLYAGATHDAYDELASIHVPTLVISPTEDKVIDPRNSHLLADKIPHSRLVELRLGHEFHTQAPDSITKLVVEFYEQATESRTHA